jgi:hypothetical protein
MIRGENLFIKVRRGTLRDTHRFARANAFETVRYHFVIDCEFTELMNPKVYSFSLSLLIFALISFISPLYFSHQQEIFIKINHFLFSNSYFIGTQ